MKHTKRRNALLDNLPILNRPVPNIDTPVLEPTPTRTMTDTMGEWYNWLVNHVPKTIKKKATVAITTMKNKIMGLYNGEPSVSIEPRLVSRAIKKNTAKWSIDGQNIKDLKVFLNFTKDQVEKLINDTESIAKKVNTVLICKIVRSDPKTGEDVITLAHFRRKTHSIISAEDTNNEYKVMRERMLELLAEYQKLGSGWRLHSVVELEIFITKCKPLKGKSYKPLPKAVMKKKAIINIKNDDDMRFKWAVTRALNPVGKKRCKSV